MNFGHSTSAVLLFLETTLQIYRLVYSLEPLISSIQSCIQWRNSIYPVEREYTVQYTVLYTVEKEYTTSELVEQPAGPGSQGVASLNCDCSEDYRTRQCCIVQFTTVQCSAVLRIIEPGSAAVQCCTVWIMAMDRAMAPLQANPGSIYIGPLHTVYCTL